MFSLTPKQEHTELSAILSDAEYVCHISDGAYCYYQRCYDQKRFFVAFRVIVCLLNSSHAILTIMHVF